MSRSSLELSGKLPTLLSARCTMQPGIAVPASTETESESLNAEQPQSWPRKAVQSVYEFGFAITFFIAYLAIWLWFIAETNLFIGLLVGWIIAFLPAMLIAAVWPGIAALILLVLWLAHVLK